MARAFRFGPPTAAQPPIDRPRLAALLATRHQARLTTIVAGAGFGKTSILGMSFPTSDAGRTVWLTCEPADAEPGHLCADLASAVGLDRNADATAIADQVWSWAPLDVYLVFDDVHELPVGSAGAQLLEALLAELPANGHVVMASRVEVPVATARLAAGGRLLRIRESDLVLDEAELDAFAAARGVAPALLRDAGGWAALAELTATAGADLVYDYVWEEVLRNLGPERARQLAAFAIAGGGDDVIASAVAGADVDVASLTAGLPLVQRNEYGVELHPLWGPPLRRVLRNDEVEQALSAAAAAHRERGTYNEAIELYAEAEAWPDVLGTIRDAAVRNPLRYWFGEQHRRPAIETAQFARWNALLPAGWRDAPGSRLASGIVRRAGDPRVALPDLDAAIDGFAAADDPDGEAAAIAAKGLVLLWTGDVGALAQLQPRVAELAASGSRVAAALRAIGAALVAHLVGDSTGVYTALAAIESDLVPGWEPVMRWFEAVALRRDGELDRAMTVIADWLAVATGQDAVHIEHAAARTRWLRGEVDGVCEALADLQHRFAEGGDAFNAQGAEVELATKVAWLGDPAAAAKALAPIEARFTSAPGPMAEIMAAIARASVLVAQGDDAAAADVLREPAGRTLDRPDGWYWRDRGAVALLYVLLPESRAALQEQATAPCHATALELAKVLESARNGAPDRLRTMEWPEVGVLRACLPLRWIAELAARADAAGVAPPYDLGALLGDRFRAELQRLTVDAASLLDKVAATPAYELHVQLLGPLVLSRDGDAVTAPELRRQRVRELLSYLVAHRRVRREQAIEDLWPDIDDRGRNLRVTLSHLQRLLQPERTERAAPYFLRADGPWLVFEPSDRLTVDAWSLEELLDRAAAAERAGNPRDALDAYTAALPLWRGEPFADHPYSDWATTHRDRLRARFSRGARRAAELLLAAERFDDAIEAAQAAVVADRADEAAYQLLARAQLGGGDIPSARATLRACQLALDDLGVPPGPATAALLAQVG